MAKSRSRVAPLDQLSGLPLSIFYDSSYVGTPTNFQHGWHSKNRLKEVMPTSWARALRISRGYVIPMTLHMAGSPTGYHEAIHEGPNPPKDIDEVYSAVGLAAARVVPRLSIDLTTEPGWHKLIPLNNKQHAFLSRHKRMGYEGEGSREDYYRRKSLGEFVVEYSLRKRQETQELSTIEDELLRNPKLTIAGHLGAATHRLFIDSIKELSGPVDARFNSARLEGMVAEDNIKPSEVMLGFVPEHQFGAFFETARQNLTGNSPEALQTGVNGVELAA